MTLETLVALVFLASTAAIVGLYVLVAGKAKAALRQQVEGRLQEMSGVAEADGGALIKTAAPGPLPAVDRMVTETATGSAVERWLEQSGVAISLSGLLVASLLGALLFGSSSARSSSTRWRPARARWSVSSSRSWWSDSAVSRGCKSSKSIFPKRST